MKTRWMTIAILSLNFIEDFFNVGQKVYIISEIISSNMNYEIVWLLIDYVIEFI